VKELWDIIKLDEIPLWAKLTGIFLVIGIFAIDKIGGFAAKFAGFVYQSQAHLVANMEARLLSLTNERDHERERAEHEAKSRAAADERMHAALAEIDHLQAEILKLRKSSRKNTGE
jgi:hypothetical protein